jgi:hypothetical protein
VRNGIVELEKESAQFGSAYIELSLDGGSIKLRDKAVRLISVA